LNPAWAHRPLKTGKELVVDRVVGAVPKAALQKIVDARAA
jgi:hypothetical protein